jgi:hypothetical protein
MYFIAVSTQKCGTASPSGALWDAVVVLGLCAKLAKKQHNPTTAEQVLAGPRCHSFSCAASDRGMKGARAGEVDTSWRTGPTAEA